MSEKANAGKTVVPDEAVEAAARAWLERSTKPGSWTLEGSVRAALEAAAPFMLAKAWHEGHQAGWNDRDGDAQSGWVPSGYAVDTPNPHRPTP